MTRVIPHVVFLAQTVFASVQAAFFAADTSRWYCAAALVFASLMAFHALMLVLVLTLEEGKA